MRKKHTGRALVIQIGEADIRIAGTSLGASAPQLSYSTVIPTPEGAVEDGAILDPEALQEALRGPLSAPEIQRIRRAVFVLCSTQVLSGTAAVPPGAERQMDKLLSANADLYFPVDTADYHLVWSPAGVDVDENGDRVRIMQLWAVPNGILDRYYALANGLGLSVEAVDYCGSSIAGAVGAAFDIPQAARRVRGGRKAETAQAGEAGPGAMPAETQLQAAGTAVAVAERPEEERDGGGPPVLYLVAEPDFLLMTFVRDGQVRLQRFVQWGGDLADALGELRMAIEFYRSMPRERLDGFRVELCGLLAEEAGAAARLEQELGVPARVWEGAAGPAWCLCLGAARVTLDFGVPALDRPRRAVIASQAWQYGLILGGGLLLAGSLVLNFGSRAVWNSTLDGLESSRDTLRLQSLESAAYTAAYREYEQAYDNYDADWDALLGSRDGEGVLSPGALRTYNDNLVLVLDALEDLLPTTTSVTEIGVAAEGIALQLACPDKEEAAYVLSTLRERLPYGELSFISDLTVGPGLSARDALPSLAQQEQAATDGGDASGEQAADGEQAQTEQPPTEGSQYDLGELLEIMEQAAQQSGSTDYADILAYALENGMVTREDLEQALMNLTPEQLAVLEQLYGVSGSTSYTLDELLADATPAQREAALRTMLTEDPIALYQFFMAFREDIYRPAGTEILLNYISDDIWNSDFGSDIMSGNMDSMEDALPEVLDILTKDEETLAATERLIQTDDALAGKLAYYLALEMGLDPAGGGGTGGTTGGGTTGGGSAGAIDVGELIDDIVSGNLPEDDEGLKDVISAITGDSLSLDALMQLIQQGQGSGGASGLEDIFGEGIWDIFDPESGQSQEPADTRIFVTVTISYSQELLQQELERKGLSYDAKEEKLEVAQ